MTVSVKRSNNYAPSGIDSNFASSKTNKTNNKMKKLLTLFVAVAATILSANAQYNYGSTFGTSNYGTTNTNSTYVNGYTKSNGTYVQGHHRSTRNDTNHDNWSTIGNTNIHTGTSGNRAKDYSTGAYNYGTGHTIHTGSRGGQYYINSHGKKTYVPKRR